MSVLTAIMMVTLTGAAGLCVDLGAIYLRSRQLQGIADDAAMAAAQDLAHAERRAKRVLTIGGLPDDVHVEMVSGHYGPDVAVSPANRFVANAADANAVRVEIREDTPLFFSALFVPSHKMTVARAATAAQARLASSQIGSRLLAVRGGVANAALEALTGSDVSLSVMDYNSLAHADIDLLTIADALRTRVDADAISFDQVMRTKIETNEALAVVADVAERHGNSGVVSSLRAIAAAANSVDRKVALGDIIDLGPYGAQVVVGEGGDRAISVSALDLATAILELAHGGRQVRLDLAATVPALQTQMRGWRLASGKTIRPG